MIELNTLNPESFLEKTSVTPSWRDWTGIVASIGCAIHCAAMPFVIAYLPTLGLSFLADESFHQWMALACFSIAMAAFIPGFRTHKQLLPSVIAVMGLLLITGAAFGMAGDCCATCSSGGDLSIAASPGDCTDACCEHCAADSGTIPPTDLAELTVHETQMSSLVPLGSFGPWVTPIGGLLLVSAHLLNRRYGCLCVCCENKKDGSESP
ncbi:MerC mercury resistance protein [Neorhodopirellula lusitana]|uniref:MerC mercury resistance protein n=1 Tax=Neorhodopirellula lusitana TaxID=445327 RepID=A0ABY1Q8J7_9BACT|nr:MerC domain-containing protein [Neorhodopirellula lusitana]SMP60043.1 MerC mercury resistance protein [Neorhodopirellula lusitana]